MAENTLQSSKRIWLIWVIAFVCLLAAMSLLNRELVRTVSDYILLGAFCAGVLGWTMMSIKLRAIVGERKLVTKAILFAGALIVTIVISTVLSRLIGTPLAVKLFGGALPAAALVAPAAFAIIVNAPVSNETEGIEPTEHKRF